MTDHQTDPHVNTKVDVLLPVSHLVFFTHCPLCPLKGILLAEDTRLSSRQFNDGYFSCPAQKTVLLHNT